MKRKLMCLVMGMTMASMLFSGCGDKQESDGGTAKEQTKEEGTDSKSEKGTKLLSGAFKGIHRRDGDRDRVGGDTS